MLQSYRPDAKTLMMEISHQIVRQSGSFLFDVYLYGYLYVYLFLKQKNILCLPV